MKNHPSRARTARRPLRAVLLAAPAALALTLTGCAEAEPDAAGPDPATEQRGPTAPALGAAGWLAGELDDGLLVGGYGPDFGLSIDAALGLAALGGQDETVAAVADAVAARIDSYTTGVDFTSAEDVYAGSVAKAAVLTQVAGRDATDVGGRDLIALLEERVADDGPGAGRLADAVSGPESADYANAIGQAWAVQALSAADSAEADAATAYLLDQQCADGWFRLALGPVDAAGGCEDGGEDSTPDTDVTALAVLALADVEGDAAADAVEAATGWLTQSQGEDGGFGGATSTEGENANSTGLAGWALHETGHRAPAVRAAEWLAAHQVTDLACAPGDPAPPTGAVAYDDAGLERGARALADPTGRDQWRRATAQAAPVLALTGEPAAPAEEVGVVIDGRSVTIEGLAAGEQACLRGPEDLALVVEGTGEPVTVDLAADAAAEPAGYTLHRLAGRTAAADSADPAGS